MKMSLVSMFFYYMWNVWSEDECYAVFGKHYGEHFWNTKWLGYDRDIEKFYANMDEENRQKLVERARKHYDK